MRDCGRSDELRAALAVAQPLAPELAAHVAACAGCTRIRAAAHRFEARLDAAMAELVTDALPASTVAIARTAPPARRRRPSAGIVASTVMATAVMAFAAIGVVTIGASISDAMVDDSAPGAESRGGELDAIDCELGEPAVEVVGGSHLDADPAVLIAYCFDRAPPAPADGEQVVTCLRSLAGPDGRAALGAGGSRAARDVDDRDAAYLAACTRVEDVRRAAEGDPEVGTIRVESSVPFDSWDEARATVGWPVTRPGWLPDGYALAALQGFDSTGNREPIDSVVATYLRFGTPLTLDQFALAGPTDFRIELSLPGGDLRGVTTGRTTVGQHAALWAEGVAVQTSSGPGAVDTLVLTWSDGRVAYRITARDADLEALRRIAASLGEE